MKTFLYLLAAVSLLPLAAEAATNPTINPVTTTRDNPAPRRQFPEMTQQDCASLASRESNYSMAEFRNRTDYCHERFQANAQNTPGSQSGTAVTGAGNRTGSNY